MIKLHNTLTKKLETITPVTDNRVRLYSCGPTVYNQAQIGNLVSYIFADTLHRTLSLSGLEVEHVINFTDVDDKTIRSSHESYPELDPREALEKLTTHYIELYLNDMSKIGNATESIKFVRATDHIEEMKILVSRLLVNNYAYIAEDGVYFSIEAYKRSGKTYGQLTPIDTANTSQARISNDEYDKESVHDFALWKKQKQDEPAWEFSFENNDLRGRPGWHIECSAMSRALLGQPFDIHTGGIDLIFPHHENEIAQSTAGEENASLASVFAHNEHLLVDGKKMSKSANNFYTLDDIINRSFDPLAFRLMVLQSHYRTQSNFTWDNLEAAQNRLSSYRAFADLRFQPTDTSDYRTTKLDYDKYKSDILSTMENDIASPEALKTVSLLADERKNLLPKEELDDFLIFIQLLDDVFGLKLLKSEDINLFQKNLILEREIARKNKDWAMSDKYRDDLKEQGIGVQDTDFGPVWRRINVV